MGCGAHSFDDFSGRSGGELVSIDHEYSRANFKLRSKACRRSTGSAYVISLDDSYVDGVLHPVHSKDSRYGPMNLEITADLESLLSFFCVWVRAGVWMMLLPWFGAGRVPVMARIAFAGAIAYLLGEVFPYQGDAQHAFGFGLAIVNELLLGFLMALGAKVVFYALEFAAQLMSSEMSLAMSMQFNPSFEGQVTTLYQALFYFALVLFWVMGAPLLLLSLFQKSFLIMPPGSSLLQVGSIMGLIKTSSRILVLGLQMAAPIVGVNFLINLAFAILGKIVPRMNVFVTSFTIRIAAGFLILLTSIGLLTQILTDEGHFLEQTVAGLFEK